MASRRLYLLGALTLGYVSSVWGAGPAIGTASANGKFVVNNTQVTGSAALSDGASVETQGASSQVQLSNGSRIQLGANSSLTVRADQAVLEKGSGELGFSGAYAMEARTLRIDSEAAGAKADVQLKGDREVVVKAINGPVRVFSKTGVLVAKVNAGMGASFDPYAASPEDFQLSGCLLRSVSGPPYRFGFVANNVKYEVTGSNLAANVGNRIKLVGARSAQAVGLQGATVRLDVAQATLDAAGGCQAAASNWPNMTADRVPGTATAGNGNGNGGVKGAGAASHKGAIIAGVAVAGAGGGIAAAVCCKSK